MNRQLAHQITRFALTVCGAPSGFRVAFEGGGFWSPITRCDYASRCDETLLFPTLEAARAAQLAAQNALNDLDIAIRRKVA